MNQLYKIFLAENVSNAIRHELIVSKSMLNRLESMQYQGDFLRYSIDLVDYASYGERETPRAEIETILKGYGIEL